MRSWAAADVVALPRLRRHRLMVFLSASPPVWLQLVERAASDVTDDTSVSFDGGHVAIAVTVPPAPLRRLRDQAWEVASAVASAWPADDVALELRVNGFAVRVPASVMRRVAAGATRVEWEGATR